jgi:hypothetical protein
MAPPLDARQAKPHRRSDDFGTEVEWLWFSMTILEIAQSRVWGEFEDLGLAGARIVSLS